MPDTTAGDIRSVIKNATQGGLANKGGLALKKAGGVTGAGDTIATKQEIDTAKQNVTPKPNNTPVNNAKPQGVSDTKGATAIQNAQGGKSFKNVLPTAQIDTQDVGYNGINNIPTKETDIGAFSAPITPTTQKQGVLGRMNSINPEREQAKNIGDGITNLYKDAYNYATKGGLTTDMLRNNAKYQQWFANVDDATLENLVMDANILAQGEYNDGNILNLLQAYQDLGGSVNLDALDEKGKMKYLGGELEGDGVLDKYVNPISWYTLFTEGKTYLEKLHEVNQERAKDDISLEDQWGAYRADQLNLLNKYRDYYTVPESATKDSEQKKEQTIQFYDKKVGKEYKKKWQQWEKENPDAPKGVKLNAQQRLLAEYEGQYQIGDKKDWTESDTGIFSSSDVPVLSTIAQTGKGIWKDIKDNSLLLQDKWDLINFGDQVNWNDEEKKKEYEKEKKALDKQQKKDEFVQEGRNAIREVPQLLEEIVGFVNQALTTEKKEKDEKGNYEKSNIGEGKFLGVNWGVDSDKGFTARIGDRQISTPLIAQLTKLAIGGGEEVVAGYADLWSLLESEFTKEEAKDFNTQVAESQGYKDWDELKAGLEYQAANGGDEHKVLNALISSKDIADAFLNDYILKNYSITNIDGFLEHAWNRPLETISDIVTAAQIDMAVKGAIGVVDKDVAKAVNRVLGYFDPYQIGTMAYSKVLSTGWKMEKGVIKGAGRVAGNLWGHMESLLTGIDTETRRYIRENPQMFRKFLDGEITKEDLLKQIKELYDDAKIEESTIGKVYEKYKNSPIRLNTFDALYKIEKMFENMPGVTTKDGKLEFSDLSFTPAQQKALQQAYSYIVALEKRGNTASVADIWQARKLLQAMTNWEGKSPIGLDAEVANKIMDMRATLGDVLKQIDEFKKADADFHNIREYLKQFKDWIDPKTGELKDSAYSKIRNLTKKGSNQPKLANLEKLLPGVTDKLKALAAAEAIERATEASVGHYASQIVKGGGVYGTLMALLSGGIGVLPVATAILGAAFLTPKNFAKLLEARGRIEAPIKGIANKLKRGVKLTSEETRALYNLLREDVDGWQNYADNLKKRGLLQSIDEEKALLKQQLKEGKISEAEFKKRMDDLEYDTATLKSRANNGDKEYELNAEESKKVGEKYGNKAENIGFTKKLEQDMTAESQKAGTTVRGYADLKNKLYNLAKNPTSTTAQHEFFHAVFSVVDEKTARYIIDEAKKILKENMSDKNAEEWLAESFGIYAKRKDVKLGILEKTKWGQGKIANSIRDLFQKSYEWIQNYNGDRKTINKLFNEILRDDLKLDADGKLDLSYLLEDKNPGGLKNKIGLDKKAAQSSLTKGANRAEGGVAMKRDVTPKKPQSGGGEENGLPKVRYKKDINGKEVQIDTKATSPDQLIEKNADGLSVMKSFISEKQAEKALDVSKELLTKDGDAYLWTHTNKYNAPQFANFESAKDSHYKGFEGREIAFLTNSEDMSKSYADQKSKLANTKSFKDTKELNNYFQENPKVWKYGTAGGGEVARKTIYSLDDMKTKDGKNAWGLYSQRKEVATYPKLENAWNVFKDDWYGHKPLGEMPKDKAEALAKLQERLGDAEVKELKNGKIQVTYSYDKEYVDGYFTKQQALAEGFATASNSNLYHYQGIVQDTKNPLVVDIRNKNGTQTKRNELGLVKDMVDQKALGNIQSKSYKDAYYTTKVDDLRRELSHVNYRQIVEGGNNFLTDVLKYTAENDVNALKDLIDNADFNIDDGFERVNGELDGLQTFREVAQNSIDLLEEYKNELKNANWDSYKPYLKEAGGDWLVSYMEHKLGIEKGTDLLLDQTQLRDAFYDYMQTNDYVFYALKNGGYDGVLFKNISDYGGKSKSSKGGDVLVAFNSKQFKAWDNANPTDSKYISYKKDTGLKSKLPDTDNDGRKLSEAQRKFFAGTKVVDKNGNLLRVYHGTQAGDFTIYQKGKNNVSNSLAKVGYWFTPNKQGALDFAKESYRGNSAPRADEVYLDIKNPKVYEPSKFNLLSEEKKQVARDKQWEVYKAKNSEADGLDYTKARGYFHDEFDHPYYERAIFADLKRSYENDKQYEGKYGKYDPEQYRKLAEEYNRSYDAKLDYDKIVKDFTEYEKLKEEASKEKEKYLDMKYDDPYEDFQYDIYKLDSTLDKKWTKGDLMMALNDYDSPEKLVEKLKSEGYDGIIIKGTEYDGSVIGGGARNDQYVAFDSNQIKRVNNLNPTKNDDIRFKKGYHGSKSEFSNFDSSHMGEGEGAQAHGWGHYIAMNKDTAKKYAQMGASNTYFKGKPLDEFFKSEEGKTYSKVEKEAIKKVAEYVPDYTPEEAIEVLPDDLRPAKTDFDKAVIRAIQNLDPDDFKPGRHLYEVDFKDPGRASTPSKWNYLDEETPYARKTFDKIFDEAKKAGWDESKVKDYIDRQLAFNGEDKMYGVWIRKALDTGFGDDSGKKTSKFLESLGYEGIHYKGLEDGEAYVIFKDTNPRITSHVMYKKDTKGLTKKQDTDSGLRYKRAYHGSPADFEKFDSSHMGEGEGAQAHGWGHYVAVDEKTGRRYADMKLPSNYEYKGRGLKDIEKELYNSKPGEKIELIPIKQMLDSERKGRYQKGDRFDIIKKEGLEEAKREMEYSRRIYEENPEGISGRTTNKERYDIDRRLYNAWNDLDKKDFDFEKPYRNLYELEIPDPVKRDTPTGSNYLEEWGSNYTKEQIEKIGKELAKKIEGKPLEQATMKDVENIAKAMHNKLSPDAQKMFVENVKEWVDKGHDIKTAIEDNIAYYTSLSSTQDEWLKAAGLRPQGKYYDAMQLWRAGSEGRNIYNQISRILGGDKEASKFLESLGYDGIHYNGYRDGEAYVVFNDDAPKITNHIRYKKDVNSEGKKLSEGQIKYFEYSKVRNAKDELIPVYRGTRNIEGDFFLWSKDHQTGDNFGKAYYFTNNKHQAEGYAHITDKDPRWIKYDAEHNGLLKKFKETRAEEDRIAFLNHGNDYDVWDDMSKDLTKYPEAMGEVSEYYLNIERPLEYDAQGKYYHQIYDKLFNEVKRDWRENVGSMKDNRYDGIIIKNVIDNSVLKDGKGELMDVYVTFNQNQAKYTNNLDPSTSRNKRFKKDTNGLAKKSNGLRKKADVQTKVSSLGRHKSEIDSFARQLGVTGDTPLQKMKQMNKIIKDPKYQGTKIKKDLYALKWNIKKEYILDNNKKIKDRGPNNTKLVVWQNGEKATWHFIPSQYYELKRMGVLE